MFSFKAKTKAPVAGNPSQGSMQNPKILEVNLIKDEAAVSFDWNKNLLFAALTMVIAIFLVAEIYFGLDWWEDQETERSQPLIASVAKINSEATKLKSQTGAALSYKEKSAAFSELLGSHIHWTNFFTWLEKNTLSTVKYKAFEGGLDGVYTIEATAQTYADVSWQAKAFLSDPLVKKVEILEAESSREGDKTRASQVSFMLQLSLKPEIFKK